MKTLLLAPFRLLGLLFGQFSWSPPKWLVACFTFLKKHLKIALSLFCAILIAIALVFYIDSLPKPISTKAVFSTVSFNSTLTVNFEYDLDALHEDQLHPEGQPSTARIDLLHKTVKSGITLEPAKAGVWTWANDNHLTFKPETPWPAGTQYQVIFDKTIFGDEIRLSSDEYSFTTLPLTASIRDKKFYQDPTDATIRRVIATINFSHPVDTESFEKRLSLEMTPKKALGSSGKKHDFSVTYNSNKQTAYIQSTPITLPNEPEFVPDIYSFLKVSNHSAKIIRNAKNKPEQVLTLEFTDPIEKDELLSKLNVYRLPKSNQPGGRSYWEGPEQVDENIIQNSVKSTLTMIPNKKSSSNIYNFVLDEPENIYLYLKIDLKKSIFQAKGQFFLPVVKKN